MANPLLYVAILGPVFAVYVPIVRGLIAEYRRLFPVSRARPLQRAAGATVRWGDRTSPTAPAADTGSTGRHRASPAPRRVMPPAGTRVTVPAGGPRQGRSKW